MGKFDADLFVLANAVKSFDENNAYQMPITEVLTPNASYQVTLEHTPVAGSISISYPVTESTPNGMMVETDSTVAAGKFKVETAQGVTTLTFAENDIADDVTISYFYADDVQEANIDNKSSAIGEALMKYPVYGSGDDCSDSAIIGYVLVHVYRCRITTAPGLTKRRAPSCSNACRYFPNTEKLSA